MNYEFTKRQRKLIGIARAKGFITVQDALALYSSRKNALNAIERVSKANILRVGFKSFIYNKELDTEVLDILKHPMEAICL